VKLLLAFFFVKEELESQLLSDDNHIHTNHSSSIRSRTSAPDAHIRRLVNICLACAHKCMDITWRNGNIFYTLRTRSTVCMFTCIDRSDRRTTVDARWWVHARYVPSDIVNTELNNSTCTFLYSTRVKGEFVLVILYV
jgi:hypothetical protein